MDGRPQPRGGFTKVTSIDANTAQIASGRLQLHIEYAIATDEQSWLTDEYMPLHTVAQAGHWSTPITFTPRRKVSHGFVKPPDEQRAYPGGVGRFNGMGAGRQLPENGIFKWIGRQSPHRGECGSLMARQIIQCVTSFTLGHQFRDGESSGELDLRDNGDAYPEGCKPPPVILSESRPPPRAATVEAVVESRAHGKAPQAKGAITSDKVIAEFIAPIITSSIGELRALILVAPRIKSLRTLAQKRKQAELPTRRGTQRETEHVNMKLPSNPECPGY